MTDLQLYLAIGVPMIAVLASLAVSLVQISGVRDDMRAMRADMGAMRAEFHQDMSAMRAEFHHDVSVIREDIKLLTGKVYELMSRP